MTSPSAPPIWKGGGHSSNRRTCAACYRQGAPVLDELEARGLVERRRSESDRRRSVVRVTAEGRGLLARADELERSLADPMFGQLEPAARAELADTLRLALGRVLRRE